MTQEALEFIDAGDQVVIEILQRGWISESDVPVEQRCWAVLTGLQNGRPTRIAMFLSRTEALEAAGLSE